MFGTVTLRQSRISESGAIQWLKPEDVRKTAWLLRDRLNKRLLPSRLVKKGGGMTFLPFMEGDGFQKRVHIHLVTAKPEDMPWAEYRVMLLDVTRRLDWVYHEIDLRQIERPYENELSRVISYVLKEGTDAFIAEAAYVPHR